MCTEKLSLKNDSNTRITKVSLRNIEQRVSTSYLLDICLWIASFFSISSMGNCGTSYGAEISFDIDSPFWMKPVRGENGGESLSEIKTITAVFFYERFVLGCVGIHS